MLFSVIIKFLKLTFLIVKSNSLFSVFMSNVELELSRVWLFPSMVRDLENSKLSSESL